MDIAVTLVIQGLVFFGVAWLVMKFMWPHIIAAIEAGTTVQRDNRGKRPGPIRTVKDRTQHQIIAREAYAFGSCRGRTSQGHHQSQR